MTKLAQEHARITALTDTQLLSIGVTDKGRQTYVRLILDTIDALANPISVVPVNRDAIASHESENDSGTEALPVCRGSMGEPTPGLICEQ
jgi:hypothetical protein